MSARCDPLNIEVINTVPDAYDTLVDALYRGPLEKPPWSSALPRLRQIFDCQVASLVLRPPAEDDRGVILNSVRPVADSEATDM
ncbi:MAG: hypothetical protein NWR12_12060, partial [Haliea sp.]|nr:hypothetical protein [Haliea sp.]